MNQYKYTSDEETIILPLNSVFFVEDSFNNVYNSTTMRIVDIIKKILNKIIQKTRYIPYPPPININGITLFLIDIQSVL